MILSAQTPAMRFFCTSLTVLLFSISYAQQTVSPYVKFGKISIEELQKKVYPLDSGANAVVLSDIGEAAVEGNAKGWFSIVFSRHRVVHILNKNGYDESNVQIALYTNGDEEEKLDNIHAVTYNLENGKIVETKLEKSNVFKEKVSKNQIIRKFTFPNVKEGSIIEYDYKVVSDFIWNLDPWLFQGSSPALWSEYTLSIPEFFTYGFLSHGYHPMYINDKKDRQVNFTVVDARNASSSDRYNFSSGVTDYRWVMKDVPELKEESFTTSVKNHIARIEFQLTAQSYPLTPRSFRTTWPEFTKGLLESESFGSALKNNNNWLSDDVKPMLANTSSETEKAKKIFAYVRDNFSCTSHSGIYTDQSLKNVMKAKKGSVSEINLLLTAMLRYAGLQADPVILSTRSHGYALDFYPMSSSFNYVVTQLNADGRSIFLDATDARLGFGKLLPYCFNGNARVINLEGNAVSLPADSLKEKKITSLFISNDEKDKWVGTINQTSGYYESHSIRDKIKEKGQEEFFKEIQKEYGMDIKIKSPNIDSLSKYDDPISLHYEVELNPGTEDIIYVNPLFGERYKKNPFESAERYYPVEMPYTMDETFVLTMEVPKGYVVDELPKQMKAKMDEKESGYFEYLISASGSTISLRCRVKFNKTFFLPEEYETLREFFNLIVSKQNEQIVFKKKK
jgi:transglutaminase-like putative cysteine protease